MPRRKKGNAISGWIIIDKPIGKTSAQVVNDVRRALNAQKAGHAGTLDPFCLLYTSPSPRDKRQSRMPSSA